eukprot:Ihof_evm7s213 gene=Ihof_evmTU7s213
MALQGLRVLEMQGLAPVPFVGLILKDFGARVIRVDKIGGMNLPAPLLGRGKESIAVNLKTNEGLAIVKKLADRADILLEPYRPGVMERLQLGPDQLLKSNPRLIYARLTGYGQTGILSQRAGHDINYAAMSGLLMMMRKEHMAPTPPGNILGDLAGGSMMCVMGVLMAVIQRGITGKGQVVDSSMVDGAAYLGTFLHQARSLAKAQPPEEKNLLDLDCPYYNTYSTKDNKWLAVGCLEPQFYQQFINGLGVCRDSLPQQTDKSQWNRLGKMFEAAIATKSRDEWEQIYKDTDACVTPVLEPDEWFDHPNTQSRKGCRSVIVNGVTQLIPSPAPCMEQDAIQ